MKKNFMTRVLAVALSAAMALSMATATNLTVAEAAAKPAMKSASFAVRIGNKAKNYYATAATQKAYKIVKAKAGNTDKATAKVVKSGKAVAITAGTKTGKTNITLTFKNRKTAAKKTVKFAGKVVAAKVAEQSIKEIKQTALDTLEVTFAVAVADVKAAEFDVARDTVNTSNQKVVVKSAKADEKDATKVTLVLYGKLNDAGSYTVTYTKDEKSISAKFVATDGTVDKIEVTPTTVTAGKDTVLYYVTYDKDGILLDKQKIDAGVDAKVEITGKATKGIGYITGNKVYLASVGDTMEVTAKYHTYKYEGAEEIGAKVTTQTITAVENATKITDVAYTLSQKKIWNWKTTTANTTLALNDRDYYLRLNPSTESGEVISADMKYTVDSSDATVFVVNGNVATDSLLVTPVGQGTAYALIKDTKGNVVYSLPIQVVAARQLAQVTLSKTTMIVSTNAAFNYASDITKATCFDQYGAVYKNVDYSLELKTVPDEENNSKTTISAAMINHASGSFNVKTGSIGYKTGHYVYVVTAKDKTSGVTRPVSFDVEMRAPEASSDDSFDIILSDGDVTGYATTEANTAIYQYGVGGLLTTKKLTANIVVKNNGIVSTATPTGVTVGAIYVKKNGVVLAQAGDGLTTKTCAAVSAFDSNVAHATNMAAHPVAIDLVKGSGSSSAPYFKTLEPGSYTVEATLYTTDNDGNVVTPTIVAPFTVKDTEAATTVTVLKTDLSSHTISSTNEKIFTWQYDGVDMVKADGKVNDTYVKGFTTTKATVGGWSTGALDWVSEYNNDDIAVATPNTYVLKTGFLKLAMPEPAATAVNAGNYLIVPVSMNRAFTDYKNNSTTWTIN